MFESVEEVDQIETDTKNEEAKQVPKMPNGALQNETSSPDSGHPSSRNFSVTSGLSDGSLSTEDSGATDATQKSAYVPQASQSPVKPAGIETGNKDEEKVKAPREKNKAEEGLQSESQGKGEQSEAKKPEDATIEYKDQDTSIKEIQSLEPGEKGKRVCVEESMAGTESKRGLAEHRIKRAEVSTEETSKQTDVEKNKEIDELKTNKPQEVRLMDEKGKIAVHPDVRVSRERETYYTCQKDEAQVMTESDESPSAIEMEEIPKAKVSMVPWSRKGHCEASSSSEDSGPHKQEEQGKLSPEGTESVLSDEPEMESLYPHFDAGSTKDVTSQESTGSSFSVRRDANSFGFKRHRVFCHYCILFHFYFSKNCWTCTR